MLSCHSFSIMGCMVCLFSYQTLFRRRIERHAVALDDALDLTASEHLREGLVDELLQLRLFRLDRPGTVPAQLRHWHIAFHRRELGVRMLQPSLGDRAGPQ